MKYVRVLGLLAVAAAATMAFFAASASATTVTGPTITNGVHQTQAQIETPNIHAVNEGTHVSLHNDIANIECKSTVTGDVESHGTGVTAAGAIDELKFFECTGGWVVDVEAKGSLEIHYIGPGTGHGEGTLTSNGATVTATRFGVSCRYKTNNTHIGTVTGGDPVATLHIEAEIPFHGGSFLCGGEASAWTGDYVTTHTLKIDP